MSHDMDAGAYYLEMVQMDPVLEALDELVAVLEQEAARIRHTVERVETIRRQRLEGRSYREIEENEPRPLIVEVARDSLAALVDAGSRLRRAEASALYAEGMTMEQIAELFGVTRQRVSALLRNRRS
jgi:hypothetical protein